jgi:hypothetical protein
MELVSISLARVAVFLEIQSLDPRGAQTPPEGAHIIAQRYGFARVPKTADEMDFQKGVTFAAGRFENIAIDQVQIFSDGIIIDTRSTTDDSLRVLNDLLAVAREKNGANIRPTRMHCVSQVVFRSKLQLALLNPLLQPIADRLSEQTSKDLSHSIRFEPTVVLFGPETWQLKIAPNQFSIERRAGTPFNENTYFSAAPLPTVDHLKLIEEVEVALSPKQ